MARFLLAWELGEGLGHVNRLLPLATALRDGGHDTTWAVKDVAVSGRRLAPDLGPIVAAPVRPNPKNAQTPFSLADILATLGFSRAETFWPMLKAWIDLLQLVRPDALIGDYAPTALLAARVLDIPAASIGNGFEVPPDQAPLPSLQPWQSVPRGRLERSEKVVLHALNSVLRVQAR